MDKELDKKNPAWDEVGKDEKERWESVYEAVVQEIKQTHKEWSADKKLARELTSQIVASRRDEDKASLASDEAVAHGLSKLRKDKTTGLASLIDQPYFARVITKENGKEIEFRLSTASLPSQRIIDWRKAPISKLYYDYQQGEEFFAEIQGREREGRIKLRRSYHGVEKKLNIIELPEGSLTQVDDQWELTKKQDTFSRDPGQSGHLPPILSLITKDQFELITENPEDSLVIQGIAGSGKTTVALHRLAWLLHEDNTDCQAHKSLVVMQSPGLKAYVQLTLPELKVDGVPIQLFTHWSDSLLKNIIGDRPKRRFPKTSAYECFKSSYGLMEILRKYMEVAQDPPQDHLTDLFAFFQHVIDHGDNVDPSFKEALKEQIKEQKTDDQDDTLLLQLIYLREGYYPVRSPAILGELDHLVIDEAQDFGLMEITALLYALKDNRAVTLVGDLAQKIRENREFASWEEMLSQAGFENTTPISLDVSHRTTQQIINVAHTLRGDLDTQSSAIRHGPVPSFIRAQSPQEIPHYIGRWIDERLDEHRFTFCGIICRTPESAERLFQILRKKLGFSSVRHGTRDQFDFSPGVMVTDAEQVKGLEFRNVLVVEPSARNYLPHNLINQNLLYVTMTRAEYRLDFVGCEKPTPLLPGLPSYRFKENAPS